MPVHLVPTRLVLVLVLVLGFAVVPAGAESTDPEGTCYQKVDGGPEYCTTEVWFTPAETKVGNLGATGVTAFPTWDDVEPTDSVAGGAGGGYAANGVFRQVDGTTDPEAVATFVGSFDGYIDNLDVELYLFVPGLAEGAPFLASADLLVDGERIATFDSMDLPLESGGDAVRKTGFGITNITTAMERRGIDPAGAHELQLHVTGYAIATTTAVFVYDTTEVPAGMIFNTPDDELRRPAISAR